MPFDACKAASKKEREELGRKETTLVYGEISLESFGIILEKVKRYGSKMSEQVVLWHSTRSRGVFYDLGSGQAKV